MASQELVADPPWLTRIETADGRVVGAGFLVDDDLVVTCAHVVPRPAAAAPTPLVVRFVHTPGAAAVPASLAAADHHAERDVDLALVRLAEPAPTGAQAAPLVGPRSLAGHRLVIKGFPRYKDWGDTVRAFAVAQGGPQARWWELHGDAGDAGSWVDEGFSGGPVWSETADGVVAVTVAVATASGDREAYALPLEVLVEAELALGLRVRPVFEDPLTEDRLRRQLASLDARSPSTDPRVIAARYGLASAILARGTGLGEARELLERCLDDLDAAGLPPARAYGVLLSLGDLLVEQRRDQQALGRFDQAHRLGTDHFGPDDPRLCTVEERRALTHARLGDHAAAGAALRQAQELAGDVPGTQLASVLFSRAVLASGTDPEASQRLARQAYDLTRTSLGPDHPAVIRPARLLGIVLAQRGSVEPARTYLTEARDIAERRCSSDHPEVAECWASLGRLELQTRPPEALGPCLQALRKAVSGFGDDHPRLVPFLGIAALAHHARGDQAEALRLADRAVTVAEAAFGPDHLDLVEPLMTRAMHRANTGDTAAALADAERSHGIASSQQHRPPPAGMASLLAGLARIRLMADELPGAREAAQQALDLLDGTPFHRDPVVATCRTVTGLALAAGNDLRGAEEPLRDALHLCEAWFGPEHSETGQAHLILAGVLRGQGRFKDAERSVRRGLDILERTLPADHPALVRARRAAGPATRARRFLGRWANEA